MLAHPVRDPPDVIEPPPRSHPPTERSRPKRSAESRLPSAVSLSGMRSQCLTPIIIPLPELIALEHLLDMRLTDVASAGLPRVDGVRPSLRSEGSSYSAQPVRSRSTTPLDCSPAYVCPLAGAGTATLALRQGSAWFGNSSLELGGRLPAGASAGWNLWAARLPVDPTTVAQVRVRGPLPGLALHVETPGGSTDLPFTFGPPDANGWRTGGPPSRVARQAG